MKYFLSFLLFFSFINANTVNINLLNSIKKIVQKEEYIALAINKYIAENAAIPAGVDNEIDWDKLKNENYLGSNFDITNPITDKEIKVLFINNFAYIKGAVLAQEDYIPERKFVYNFYTDEVYRINTIPPKTINYDDLLIGSLVKYDFLQKEIINIINDPSKILTTTENCIKEKNFYELIGGEIVHRYCRDSGDAIDVYKDSSNFLVNDKKDLNALRAQIGTTAYVKQDDGTWKEYIFQGNIEGQEWIEKKSPNFTNGGEGSIPGNGNGYLENPVAYVDGNKTLVIRNNEGCYLVGGDIYCWGDNNYNKIGLNKSDYPNADYVQKPIMLKTVLNEDISGLLESLLDSVGGLLGGLLGGSESSSDWINSPFRTKYKKLALNKDNVCAVSLDNKLYCTGKIVSSSEILTKVYDDVLDVAMVDDAILLLTASKTLKVLGVNDKGVLGINNSNTTYETSSFINILDMNSINSIYSLRDQKTFAALDNSNKFWIWGQRGENSLSAPEKVSFTKSFSKVIINSDEFILLGEDGVYYITDGEATVNVIDDLGTINSISSVKKDSTNEYLYTNANQEMNSTINHLNCKNIDGTNCPEEDNKVFNEILESLDNVNQVVIYKFTEFLKGSSGFDLEFEPWEGTIDLSGITNIGQTNSDDQYYVDGNSNSKIDMKSGDDLVYINGDLNRDIKLDNGDDQLEIAKNSNDRILSGNGNDKIRINKDSNGEIKTDNGDDEVVISDDLNRDIDTGNGNDKITIGDNANGEIDTGNDNDLVQIYGNLNRTIDMDHGDDILYIAKNAYGQIQTDDGNDKVYIGENVSQKIDLGDDDDIIQIKGNIWTEVDGGKGTDSIILSNYTKSDYDVSWGVRKHIKNFENILFKDGKVIGDDSVFEDLGLGNDSSSTGSGEGSSSTVSTKEFVCTLNNLASYSELYCWGHVGNSLPLLKMGVYDDNLVSDISSLIFRKKNKLNEQLTYDSFNNNGTVFLKYPTFIDGFNYEFEFK